MAQPYSEEGAGAVCVFIGVSRCACEVALFTLQQSAAALLTIIVHIFENKYLFFFISSRDESRWDEDRLR